MVVVEKANILTMTLDVYGDIENPLFLAKDVAKSIQWKGSSMADLVDMVDEEERVLIYGELSDSLRGGNPIKSMGSNRWFLTEDGVYEVLMTSRKPIAKEFRKGFKEFLKSWRKGLVKVIENKPKTYAEALIEAGMLAMKNEK